MCDISHLSRIIIIKKKETKISTLYKVLMIGWDGGIWSRSATPQVSQMNIIHL